MYIKQQVLFGLCLFISIVTTAKTEIYLYTKDNKQYILEDESKKEGNILLSQSFKYKETTINISNVDSLRIGDAVYKSIKYKDKFYMARMLFSGYSEGYKIHYEGEKIVLLKSIDKEEYVPITKTNKLGAYNYIFSDCFKKDSNLYKIKSSSSDDNIIKEVTQKINCQNKEYTIYKKPLKIGVYIAPVGGINLYKPKVSAKLESNLFNHDKQKPKLGYSVGGKIGFVINDKIDIGITTVYSVSKAILDATVITEFYSTKYTTIYKGYTYNKSIDIDINIKYIILKSKLSPTIFAGIYFSNKIKNNAEYSYTYNNSNPINEVKDLADQAIGINIGLGACYRPINRINFFIDLGYKIGAGFLAPNTYKVSEGTFYTIAGLAVKLNK